LADESENQSGEKTEDPSSYRIEEFRKRGDVASSKELTSSIVLGTSFFVLSVSLIYLFQTFGDFIRFFIGLNPSFAFTDDGLKLVFDKALDLIISSAGPILAVILVVSLISTVSQIGFLFSPDVLTIDFNRVNPFKGVGRIFSMKSLVEAIKGVFKFLLVIGITYYFLKDEIHHIKGFYQLEIMNSFLLAKEILLKLSFAIVGSLLVLSIFDFGYQKYSYFQRLKQTKEELKRETKEREGSPEVKQRMKMIQREAARKRMMEAVPKADVIVTNPTHLSIALQYDGETMVSPTVTAKGADHLALKIREIAKENNIPIVENIPLARTLYKTVKVDEPVPRGLYKAVAEVLAFVYRMKRRRAS